MVGKKKELDGLYSLGTSIIDVCIKLIYDINEIE